MIFNVFCWLVCDSRCRMQNDSLLYLDLVFPEYVKGMTSVQPADTTNSTKIEAINAVLDVGLQKFYQIHHQHFSISLKMSSFSY